MELNFKLVDIDNVAKKLILVIGNLKIVGVNGVMGAGKTTLIHAICRQLGVTDKMSSPTYSIIQQYNTKNNLIVNHIDVYRLKDTDEAIRAGVEDTILSGDICFIEWSEKIFRILPSHFISIFIEPADHTHRRLVINIR